LTDGSFFIDDVTEQNRAYTQKRNSACTNNHDSFSLARISRFYTMQRPGGRFRQCRQFGTQIFLEGV